MVDRKTLYELPWTRNDNPNGWIEPTTKCQLKCPLCFRGADLDGHRAEHVDLVDVKRDIDDLIRLRRVSTITIAGGDPLLYPHLDEMIDYIRSKNVEAMVLTNGIDLDEARLRRFKAKEVARIVIHIDKYQGRQGIRSEEQTLPLRRSFCELFRKVGGVSLGFIQPIAAKDFGDLEVLLPFYKENADVVDLVAFNRMQPVGFQGSRQDGILEGHTLIDRVREVYGLEYSAYLGKTHSDEIGWLFGQAVFIGNRLIGSLDKEAFRFFQEEHRRRAGQYLHCSRTRRLTPKLLLYVPFNKSLRSILFHRLGSLGSRNGAGKLNHQLILIVNTPTKLEDGDLDRCKGCPDAMMFGGKLVPSCVLERVKAGEMMEAG